MEPETKPCAAYGPTSQDGRPTGSDLETFVAPLGAGGDVDHVGGGVGDVEVEVHVLLPVQARIEFTRGFGSERRVDGVLEEEVRLVGAVAGTGVPVQAVGQDPSDTAYHGHVGDHAAELGCEPARGDLPEREAVRVLEHPRQGGLVRHVVGDAHGGAVGRSVDDAVTRIQHVRDHQRLALVEAVDVGPVVGIPEIETFRHLFLGVVGVAVELHAVGEQVAEVAEELDLVLDGRVAPDLGRVGHGGVAGCDQGRRVGALHASVRGVGVAIFQAEVGEACLAQRQSHVAGDGVRITVARAVGAGVELDAATLPGVFEQEVDHAGDGVRAVLGRCAVPQHLYLA